jgi:hypothetical protein
MATQRKARQCAPRLWGGRLRDPFGSRLPHAVKEGLRSIARSENKSMSWVVEEVLIDYFKLPRPKYVERKRKGR